MKRDQIEELFYGKPEHQRRFTQDFPILPDVWIEYGQEPGKRVEALLTPHHESDAPTMARLLPGRLEVDAREHPPRRLDTRQAEPRPQPAGSHRIGVLNNRKVLDRFLASETKNEKRHTYFFRKENDLSIPVPLAD
jgi:hypothetical protein